MLASWLLIGRRGDWGVSGHGWHGLQWRTAFRPCSITAAVECTSATQLPQTDARRLSRPGDDMLIQQLVASIWTAPSSMAIDDAADRPFDWLLRSLWSVSLVSPRRGGLRRLARPGETLLGHPPSRLAAPIMPFAAFQLAKTGFAQEHVAELHVAEVSVSTASITTSTHWQSTGLYHNPSDASCPRCPPVVISLIRGHRRLGPTGVLAARISHLTEDVSHGRRCPVVTTTASVWLENLRKQTKLLCGDTPDPDAGSGRQQYPQDMPPVAA